MMCDLNDLNPKLYNKLRFNNSCGYCAALDCMVPCGKRVVGHEVC
jgi:hypothetical protein